MANATKRILAESLAIPIGASLPPPPISLHSEGVPPIKFDPRDIYGMYPNNFGNMAT